MEQREQSHVTLRVRESNRLQLPLQSIYNRNLHRSPHQSLHKLRYLTCYRKGRDWQASELSASIGSCLIPLALPNSATPSTNIALLRPPSTRRKRTSVYRCFLSQAHTRFLCGHNLVSVLIQRSYGWIVGILVVNVWRTSTFARPDTQCGTLVVLFYRDVRLIPRVLSWGFLAASGRLRWRLVCESSQATVVHNHSTVGNIRYFQAISESLRYVCVLCYAAIVQAHLPLSVHLQYSSLIRSFTNSSQ